MKRPLIQPGIRLAGQHVSLLTKEVSFEDAGCRCDGDGRASRDKLANRCSLINVVNHE